MRHRIELRHQIEQGDSKVQGRCYEKSTKRPADKMCSGTQSTRHSTAGNHDDRRDQRRQKQEPVVRAAHRARLTDVAGYDPSEDDEDHDGANRADSLEYLGHGLHSGCLTPATGAGRQADPAPEGSALLVLVMAQGLAQCPSDSETRCRSDGSNSTSNHGFLRSQILFLGLGCGSGIILGQYVRHDFTRSVTEELASPKWYFWAYRPSTTVTSN